ncbi:MAG: hypothetical protein ACW98X_26250 [Promethearchaeota archaeon]
MLRVIAKADLCTIGSKIERSINQLFQGIISSCSNVGYVDLFYREIYNKKEVYAFNKVIIRHSFIILAICFGVVFLLTIASANAYVIEVPPYYGLNVKFNGTVTESYNNNITFAEDEENKIEDFVTNMTLGLNMQYEGKKRFLRLAGRINRQIRTRSRDVLNSYENASIDFQNQFSNYDTIHLGDTYSHTQVPGSFEEEFGRIKGRFEFYSNSFNINYDRDITEHVKIVTRYSYGLNWSSQEGTKDSTRNHLGFNINYKLSASTDFLLSYAYATGKFEGGGDISTNSFSTGIRRYITKRLYFNGSIGNTFSSMADSVFIKGELNSEIDKKTEAKLLYSRGIEISSYREDLFRNWRMTFSLARRLLEDFNSSLSAFYGKGKFVTEDFTDRLMGANIMLTYNFWEGKKGQRINGRVGYIYSKLDSTYENRDYQRSVVDFGLTVQI